MTDSRLTLSDIPSGKITVPAGTSAPSGPSSPPASRSALGLDVCIDSI